MQWFALVNADQVESTRPRAERHRRIRRKIGRRLERLLVNGKASQVTTIEGFQPCSEHAAGSGVRYGDLRRICRRYFENRDQGKSSLHPKATLLGSHARTGHPGT